QYMALLGLTGYFLFQVGNFSLFPKIACSVMIIWTTVSFSGIFEKRNWYFPQEILRLVSFAFLVVFLVQSLLPLWTLIAAMGIYTLCSLVWLWRNQRLKTKISPVSLSLMQKLASSLLVILLIVISFSCSFKKDTGSMNMENWKADRNACKN